MVVNPNSLQLIFYPDAVLRQETKEVDAADEHVQAVAAKMIEMMFESEGIGLAAPQLGLPWRIFVTRDPEDETKGHAWINPSLEVINDKLEVHEEGCLSLPEIRGDIKRPIGIRITAFDVQGNPVSEESEEFITRVWQHEFDHLLGVLIIDKMTAMDRLSNRRKIRKLEKASS